MICFPLRGVLLALCGVAALHAPAVASCVSKPVTLVVPYPAGGTSDLIARALSQPLSRHFGQPVLVENQAGAAGSIAAQKVLSAPADGHTLFLGSPNEVILAPLANAAVKVRHDQFRLLGRVAVNPLVMLARKDLPANSIDELIAYARKPATKPLTYGSVGYGSLYHFAGEDLAARTGTTMIHIPYKGGAPLTQDIGGGLVDFAMLPWGTRYRGLADQGRLKFIGWVGPRHENLAPDIPAFGEGKLLPSFEYSTWAGLMVRKDMPFVTVACLHQVLTATLQQAEVQQAILATGSKPPGPQTLDQSEREFAAEAVRFQTLARKIKLQPQ